VRDPKFSPPPEDEDFYAPAVPRISERRKEAPKYNLSEGLSKFKNPTLPFKPPSRVERDMPDQPSLFASSTTTNEMSTAMDNDPPEREEVMEEITEQDIPSTQAPISPRPPQLRSHRRPDTQATITIGDRAPVTTGVALGESPRKKRRIDAEPDTSGVSMPNGFAGAFSKFMAPGTQRPEDDVYQSLEASRSITSRTVAEVDGDTNASHNHMEAINDAGQEHAFSQVGRDIAQQELLSGDISSYKNEQQSLDVPESGERPLFLPDEDIDQDSESDSGEEQTFPSDEGLAAESPELPLAPPETDQDYDYVPETEAEAERRASARAARLLKEVEAYEATHPIDQLLERNLRLLSDSQSVSTNGTMRFERASLERIQKSAQRVYASSALLSSHSANNGTSEDLFNSQDEAAEQRLSLTVTKEDFMNMKIHGQFNKGFILATRKNELFIIDQHASDEKYNFETLQATTVVQSQPLVVPRTLDLMAMDEIAVMDNLDVLKKNGFVVDIDPEMPTGRRCKLISLPMSKETVFGIEGESSFPGIFLTRHNADGYRLGGTYTLDPPTPRIRNEPSAVLEGSVDVRDAGMQEECHGRQSTAD
jgi:DNA mismatch repair protein PMS2